MRRKSFPILVSGLPATRLMATRDQDVPPLEEPGESVFPSSLRSRAFHTINGDSNGVVVPLFSASSEYETDGNVWHFN